MSVTEAPTTSRRLLTIGSVCSRLKPEFPDISISKIRYLEDQGLLALRRTQGGYRLFSEEDLDLGELCRRAGISGELARELEDYGLLEPHSDEGEKLYGEGDVDIAVACARLAQFGIAPRHLRAFRTAATRQSGLLEAVVAPALRSRNPERRKTGMEDLQELAELAQELAQLLFWRELRQLVPA